MSLTASGATEVEPLMVMTGLADASAIGCAEAADGTRTAAAPVTAHTAAMRLRMEAGLLSSVEAALDPERGSGGSVRRPAGRLVKNWITTRNQLATPRQHAWRPDHV